MKDKNAPLSGQDIAKLAQQIRNQGGNSGAVQELVSIITSRNAGEVGALISQWINQQKGL